MATPKSQRLLASTWDCERLVMDGSAQKISKPAAMKELRTVIIQARGDNAANIYFGNDSTVDAGTKAGGELQGAMSAVLPISDTEDSELYVKGTASDVLYISYLDGGVVC